MRPTLNIFPVVFLALMGKTACVDSFRTMGTYPFRDDAEASDSGAVGRVADTSGNENDTVRDAVEQEEQSMEDPEALRALIAAKCNETDLGVDTETPTGGDTDGTGDAASLLPLTSDNGVPPAAENLRLSGKQCLSRLTSLGVSYERPTFETPHVTTPVLFTGPISGIRVGPRHQNASKRTNAVMDCHLALALVEVAHIAASLGITAIEFYSTYRPLKPPPKKCPKKGKARKRCLKKRREYKRTLAAQKSQHRFGRAIDIRWFKTSDARTLDVLEHFERRFGTPPCSYRPKSADAQRLADFVCTVYRYRLFNVMLTPNANKAHHNHFHFDLTPGAHWNIIR
jgi:hypothetical protein